MLLCDHITKLFMLNLEVKTFVLTDIINETEENNEEKPGGTRRNE